MKRILQQMWDTAVAVNKRNILSLISKNENARILDLGCSNGDWTISLANKLGTQHIAGIEIVDEDVRKSLNKGIDCLKSDLCDDFPFKENSFDVVHANQVIEHVSDIDHFIEEIYRVLKPNGYVIISTENGSSWCNIFAAIMGWQMFSLTNISSKSGGIGNPFALHRHKKGHLSSWTHKTIFNYNGLKELFAVFKFGNISIKGAGYFPLPSCFGQVDVRHSHFITLKGYKTI